MKLSPEQLQRFDPTLARLQDSFDGGFYSFESLARELTDYSASVDLDPARLEKVRARRDLVVHRVAAANQLRTHLQLVFPGAVSLFAAIDTAISLCFLERFTTQTHADWLSVRRLGTWLASVGG